MTRSVSIGLLLASAVAQAQTAATAQPPTSSTPAATAQQAPADSATPPAPVAQTPYLARGLGLFVYPAKNQDAKEQGQDEHDCWVWAGQQTGVDPVTLKPDPNAGAAAKAQAADATQGAAVVGGVKGAVGGAVIGGIAGNAGKGAAIGAVVGTAAGRRKKKKAEAQAEAQGQQQANAQAQAKADMFKKAMSACLTGRGYTVQ
jgi:hypothetical protein